jgi:CRISPR-associated protein Cas1
MEPFRCLVENQIRNAFNTKQCKAEDFDLIKGEYILKREKNTDYTKMFYEVLVEEKKPIFMYMQSFYRSFMRQKESDKYPRYLIK